jgi:filamentous hemagglutinin family protein
MRRVRRVFRELYFRQIVAYFLISCMLINTSVVRATPSGGVFTVGGGDINPVVGGNSTVVVNQAQSVIEWGSSGSGGIDTSSSESLSFSQLDGLSNSAVLNRIMSGNPTQFDGTLNGAGMRIFIVNQAGIIFGSGSSVNVTQLVASTLGITNENFLADKMIFEGGGGIGDVTNYGQISAEKAALIGRNVVNRGVISAEDYVILAAGDSVIINPNNSHVVVEVAMTNPAEHVVDNGGDLGTGPGAISAEDGHVILAAGDIFSTAIEGVESLRAQATRNVVLNGDVTAGSPTTDDPYISISTTGGDITTGGFDIRGRGTGVVSVDASGKLEINGDTSVKIQSNPEQFEATAEVLLTAGKSVVVNGDIDVEARGKIDDFAHIFIEAGKGAVKGWDATINGNMDAWSHTSAHGDSYALIELYASGEVILNGTEDPFAHAGEGNGRAKVQGDFDVAGDEAGKDEIIQESDTYTAEIIIGARHLLPNQPPIGEPDGYTVNQNSTLTVGSIDGVLINDSDPDSDPLTAILVDGPLHGTLVLHPDGSFTYIPNAGYKGGDSFTYIASDGDSQTLPILVIITVKPVGDNGGGGNGGGEEPKIFILAAPLPEHRPMESGGCPALMNWLAGELGIPSERIDIFMADVAAYSPGIQPCKTCARLKDAAGTLADSQGTMVAAIGRVVSQFVTTATPPSDEQMALIATALANPDEGTDYAVAKQWLDAMAQYVGVLTTEMGFSTSESVSFVSKYVSPVREGGNATLAAYLQTRLAQLGG